MTRPDQIACAGASTVLPRSTSGAASGTAARRAVLCFVVLLGLAPLCACGFHPVYGGGAQQGAVQDQLAQIEIGLIADKNGQYLRNALIDRMRPAAASAPRYFLRVHRLHVEDLGFGMRKDASTTRGDITVTATLDLIDTETNTIALSRALFARGGYDRTDNLFGALMSKENTTEGLLDEIAEQAVTQLALFLGRGGR